MIAGKHYVPVKADLWSWGVILYAMICGYLPFEDANTSQLYKKILAGEYSIPKHLSKDAVNILAKILDVLPDTRYTIN
jgi:5'-AMP-activated protein kinase catalytic alpha subunit